MSYLVWLLVWQVLAMFVNNDILLVTPLQTIQALGLLMVKATFWKVIGVSICRIGAGFLLGTLTALLLAMISKRFSLVEKLLSPIITLCKAVPVAVFVVLLLIWWGSSFLAVAICFLIVLPNLYISTLEGLKNTDKKLLEMAKVFRLPAVTRFFYIYRPALKPFLSSSLKLALGMCWKSGVAAEVIGTPQFSIGEQLYMSKIHLDTAGVFAWATVIILLSVGFEQLVMCLMGLFWNWNPACWKKKTMRQENCNYDKIQNQNGSRMSEPMELSVENITKAYGEQCVLQDVNVVYQSDEIYYLTAPSGSGKTTFLRILCGLEQPDNGTISPGLRYSMVFQEDRLCEEYSALQNVEMIIGNRSRAEEALGKVLEKESWDKPCNQLSGGMKRRVSIVRAMESPSDCVLLDEPFTGMDTKTKEQVEQYIKERQNGRILVIVTHI